MPPVIVGAALSAGVGAALGGTFTTLFVQNLALGLISNALAPKPSAGALQTSDNTQSVKSPIASRKVVYGRTRVGGTIVYLESTGSDNKYLHMVLALASHEVDALEKVYFDDDLVWSGGTYQSDWANHARVKFHDGTQTTADSDLVAESDGNWTSAHVLNDTAYLYLRLKFNRDKYANGIPNISAVIRGKKVYDPRTTGTDWSQNPALCIRDYLLNEKYGMDVDTSELNATSWNSAATLCDEIVTTSTGSQSRYLLDGVVDTAQSRKSIIEAMLTSMGGSLIYSGGEFYIEGSSYRTPTVTLDEAVVVDTMQIQTKRSRRELFNGVKGVFSSTQDNYVLTDYPALISSTYELEDGSPSYLDVDLPYTTDVFMAERLAKLTLLRSRKQITCTVRCNLSAISLRAGDTVMLSNTRMGWSSKIFEVTNLSFEADGDGRLSVALNLIETSADVYDWTTSDEIPFVAGQPTNLATPFSVSAPTALTVNTNTIIQSDGTARPAFDIAFTNNDAFATSFEIQYAYGGGSYKSVLTNETVYRLEDVVVGEQYTIQVRAINKLGARSSFTLATKTAAGDTGAPAVPTGLTASGQFNAIYLSWTNPPDKDLDVIEIYEGTSTVQANATLVATAKGTSYTRGALENGVTRYYWLKSLDYSGNRSGFNSPTGVSATTLIPITSADIVGTIEVVTSLTTGLSAADIGKVEFLESDEKLYRWSGSEWITGVVIDDVSGSITADRIDVATLSSITANIGTLNAGKLQNDDETFIVDLDNKKIYIA